VTDKRDNVEVSLRSMTRGDEKTSSLTPTIALETPLLPRSPAPLLLGLWSVQFGDTGA
jgi:hypothetical protein